VGDNVGDCAGMAADIFESYEVTIVAAMILGLASFGHKGVIFPLLVRGIGVLGSIISTYTVKAGAEDTSDTALKSVHRGFWIGSMISVAGFFVIGLGYLYFDQEYFNTYKMAQAGFPGGDPTLLPAWANFGISGLDMRPALTCLIGVFLAIALNKVTSYYTHTSHSPVKTLARSCQTGHATNIIQGFAVGYESTVAAVLVIAGAVFLSVICYWGTPAVFIAFGVAMTGIGMLTLTGNTISMDVFGPVADNANGIGEMGYNKDMDGRELQPGAPGYMTPAEYKRARQILADLDAVGNTTKAITKGVAIGSAVTAAVALFGSFITDINLVRPDFGDVINIANPRVFIGLLIGGGVPILFGALLVKAVSRAANGMVAVVRKEFDVPGVREGTVLPDYKKAVAVSTEAAQRELLPVGILVVLIPIVVGFLLKAEALGGFLAGVILSGQLLAVFMSNAGGAWDNAKKLVEEGHHGGKGSEAHKASIVGDTVGDPLKDTAGPALNPLIKVINLISLIIAPIVVASDTVDIPTAIIMVILIGVMIWAIRRSKRPALYNV